MLSFLLLMCVHARTHTHTHTYVICSSQNYVSFFLNLAMKKPMVSESQSFSALWAKRPGSNLCTSWHSPWDREDCVNPQPPRWGFWNTHHHYFKVVHLPSGDSETHITTGQLIVKLKHTSKGGSRRTAFILQTDVRKSVSPVAPEWCQERCIWDYMLPQWWEKCVRAYLLFQSDVRKGV